MTRVTSPAVSLIDLAELSDAEQQLREDLARRDEQWAAEPSALPDWTRAHVVAHLAGNAEGLGNLTIWAATGVRTPMYPSREVRAQEIGRRARLPWAELVAEQAKHSTALLGRLEQLAEPLAERVLEVGSGSQIGAWELPAVRRREVEIHRVDLGDTYRPKDWSSRFTLQALGQLAPFFLAHRDVPIATLRATDTGRAWAVGTGPDLIGTESALLAWLVGRGKDGTSTSDGSPVPDAPRWV